MTIINLLADLSDSIIRANRKEDDEISRFASPGPAQKKGYESLIDSPVVRTHKGYESIVDSFSIPHRQKFTFGTGLECTETVLDCADQGFKALGDGLPSIGFGLASSSAAGLETIGFVPAMHECFDGVHRIVSGIKEHDTESILTGTENILTFNAEVIFGSLKIADVGGVGAFVPGADAVTSLISLAEGFQWLHRAHGRRIASQVIYSLLVQNSQAIQLSLRSSVFQKTADLKLSYFQNLNPFLSSMCWTAYKYYPGWLTEAQGVIHRIGLPMLGLASGIIGLIAIFGSIASLGIVPIILASTGAAIGLGILFYRNVKYLQSKNYYHQSIEPFLTEAQKKEIRHCVSGSHRLFGVTVGDYFRYQLSVILFNHWKTCSSQVEEAHSHVLLRTLSSVTEPVMHAMIDAIWDILRKDLGHRAFSKLYQEMNTRFESQDPNIVEVSNPIFYAQARFAVIKLLFGAFRVSRS